MGSNEELVYSDFGKLNRFIYYTELNDINIFVEDEDKEYEYETIFKRMFGDSYRITTIFATGGKPKLVEAYQCFGQYSVMFPNEKNIFIADGDFDKLIEADMINDNRFIYLNCYNIENYYIDEIATKLFVKGKLKKTDDEIDQIICFDNWLNTITDQYYKLFLLYCVVKKYRPQIKNVARGANSFIDNSNGFERIGAYNEYYDQIKLEVEDLDTKLILYNEKINCMYSNNLFSVICGKHFIISLDKHIRNVTKCNFKYSDFRWFLVCNFDISRLDYIKEKIIEVLAA